MNEVSTWIIVMWCLTTVFLLARFFWPRRRPQMRLPKEVVRLSELSSANRVKFLAGETCKEVVFRFEPPEGVRWTVEAVSWTALALQSQDLLELLSRGSLAWAFPSAEHPIGSLCRTDRPTEDDVEAFQGLAVYRHFPMPLNATVGEQGIRVKFFPPFTPAEDVSLTVELHVRQWEEIPLKESP